MSDKPEFTAHNIRLDDGSYTVSANLQPFEEHPWLLSTLRVLNELFGEERSTVSIVDLGCLEGGYAVEFARNGFRSVGLEVRDTNLKACRYVQERVDLPNLSFIQDDANNLANHGTFDVVFCSGLLYHLDKPRAFLRTIGEVAQKAVILQTHFAPQRFAIENRRLRKIVAQLQGKRSRFGLSAITENEGLPGRWFREFKTEDQFAKRESNRWASWDNTSSFWLTRPAILQCLQEAGFDLVFEQFDNLEPTIRESMEDGYYATEFRSTFVGVKS